MGHRTIRVSLCSFHLNGWTLMGATSSGALPSTSSLKAMSAQSGELSILLASLVLSIVVHMLECCPEGHERSIRAACLHHCSCHPIQTRDYGNLHTCTHTSCTSVQASKPCSAFTAPHCTAHMSGLQALAEASALVTTCSLHSKHAVN